MTRQELLEEIRRLRQSDKPILAGPWLGEIGFELLYWVPFLRWICEAASIAPERLWILSRGGPRSWYADFAGHYIESYEHFTVDELRGLNKARIAEQARKGRQMGLRRQQVTAKQFGLTEAEQPLLDYATAVMGVPDPVMVHPSLMYRVFRPLWRPPKHDLIEGWAPLTRLKKIVPTPIVGLPERYVAVKAYTSEACRENLHSSQAMRRLIQGYRRKGEVVLLQTGQAFDEHGEFAAEGCIVPTFPAVNNLDLQTAIIAGASEFVCTYGGFAYLGPLVGTSTLGVYTDPNFRRDHLLLMKAVSHRILKVPFKVASLDTVSGFHAAA